MLRHLVGHGTPIRRGVGQPLGELGGLFADDDPSNVVADDREAEQVAQLVLQLVGCETLIEMLGYEASPPPRRSASTTASLCSVSRAP
jgi:hypothetical protein